MLRIRGSWTVSAWALSALLAGAAAAAGQEPAATAEGFACADCHDSVTHAGSVHEPLGCAECHTNVSPETHPDTLPAPLAELGGSAICAQCHDAGEAMAASVHADVACSDCHGPAHGILPPGETASSVSPFRQLETCGACHAGGVTDGFRHSVHGRALLDAGLEGAPSCSDCHGVHDILAPKNPDSRVGHNKAPETCGACHRLILEEWQVASSHGIQWKKGDPEAPVCVTCHGSHEVARPTTPGGRLGTPSTCGNCHRGPFTSYRDSFHGKATDLGFQTAANCADCHTPHKNLPADDERSTVHPARLDETCGRCHENVTASFVTFDPHAQPSNRERNPQLYYVWFFMTGLLIMTFAAFGVHDALWLQRAIVAIKRREIPRESHDGPWVRRFTRGQTVMHRVVIVSFLTLAATGLPLRFHEMGWAKALASMLGGIGMTTGLHRLAAVLTFGYFLTHVAQLFWRGVVKKEPGLLYGWSSMVPRPKDLRDVWANVKWFLYAGERPRLDRWAYWEKFDYFAVFWGVVIIGGSGLMLWLPELIASFLPGWFLNAAYVIHSDEAMLATGFIFVFHFFHTHLRPESFPLDPVIFLGAMPLSRLEHERPEEYRRLVETGKLDEHLVERPTEAERTRAMMFGFTALAIGVLLAFGMLVALIAH